MEVISIERSTYEELLTSFNSFVAQMRALADRGTDKKLGDWLDNQDVCQILNISPRTLWTQKGQEPLRPFLEGQGNECIIQFFAPHIHRT